METIPGDLRWDEAYNPGRSPISHTTKRRTALHTRVHTYRQFRVARWPDLHVSGRWDMQLKLNTDSVHLKVYLMCDYQHLGNLQDQRFGIVRSKAVKHRRLLSNMTNCDFWFFFFWPFKEKKTAGERVFIAAPITVTGRKLRHVSLK